jgi:hypothetical protein
MTRIVLCNSVPAIFDDPAVQDRTHTKYVHHPLFLESNKKKIRGTHLLDSEDMFDNENEEDELVKEFAWSYGSVSMRAIQHGKQYEQQLRSESTAFIGSEADDNITVHTLSDEQMQSLQEQSLVVIS